MTPSDIEKSRKEFKEEFKDWRGFLAEDEQGKFINKYTQRMWVGWIRRQESLVVELPSEWLSNHESVTQDLSIKPCCSAEFPYLSWTLFKMFFTPSVITSLSLRFSCNQATIGWLSASALYWRKEVSSCCMPLINLENGVCISSIRSLKLSLE